MDSAWKGLNYSYNYKPLGGGSAWAENVLVLFETHHTSDAKYEYEFLRTEH